MKDKDPSSLPTAFIVNRITDLLYNYERAPCHNAESYTQDEDLSTSKPARTTLQHASEIEKPATSDTDSKTTIKVFFRANLSGKARPSSDGLVKKYCERRCSLQSQPLQREAEEVKERRHTHPSFAVKEKSCDDRSSKSEQPLVRKLDGKIASCTKDRHVYKVEGRKVEYTVNEDINLNFLKYCNDGVRCNAWADNVDAVLRDRLGRVINFNKFKVSDGGWLLSCKAKCEGSLTAIVKANDKPITSFNINVYPVFTEPIDV